VLLVAALASFAAAWLWTQARGNDRPYYATEARAGEFLLGAAFAAFWATSAGVPRIAILRSSGAAAGFRVSLHARPVAGHRPLQCHLFRSATALDAALTCVLIAAVAAPTAGGLLGTTCCAVGLRACSLYRAWPVFVLIDHDATELADVPLRSSGRQRRAGRGAVPVVSSRCSCIGRAVPGCGCRRGATLAPLPARRRSAARSRNLAQQQLLENLPQITAAAPASSDTSRVRWS
jgi:hypothetical protein